MIYGSHVTANIFCRAMAFILTESEAEIAGEHCQKLGITIEQFNWASTCPPAVRIKNMRKGPIYELSQMRKSRGIPWIVFYENVRAICDSSFTTPFDSFKVMVGRLEKKRTDLLRNKQKNKVEILLEKPFCVTHSVAVESTEENALSKEQSKVEELSAKISHLSVRNVKERIKRQDIKLADAKAQVKEMESERKAQNKTLQKLETRLHTARASVHSLQQKVYRSKRKDEVIDLASKENFEFHFQLEEVEAFLIKIAKLQEKNDFLVTEVEVA